MDTETMIRNLEKVEADHKDDKVFTGQLNIAEMAHDVRKRLEELKPYEDTGLTPPEIMELKERNTAMEINEIHVDEYYCPACGAENNCDQGVVEDNFCPRCGRRPKDGRTDDERNIIPCKADR